MSKNIYSSEKNDINEPEQTSPSGKYSLVISHTDPYHTCGKVFVKDGETPIAIIEHNYHTFPYLFVERHNNGHDYLICSEDYQGQVVIELDTGKRFDRLDPLAKDGIGFIWTELQYNHQHQLLIIEGCVWAFPFEFRFFDFSDPVNGWPEIVYNDDRIDTDSKWPTFEDNGKITTYKTHYCSIDDEPEEFCGGKLNGLVISTNTFKREDNILKLVESWESLPEVGRRMRDETISIEYEKWLEDFKANDELYLTYKARLYSKPFPLKILTTYEGIGLTYDGWCPHFDKQERRITKDLCFTTKHNVRIEWATSTGPILISHSSSKNNWQREKKWFEHSVAGMNEALNYAAEVITKNKTLWDKIKGWFNDL